LEKEAVKRVALTFGIGRNGWKIYYAYIHGPYMKRVTTRDDIAAVIALYKANHVLREISAQTGVALRVVQNLVKRFRDLGEDELPAPLPKSGRPKLLSPRTLKVISRQVRSNPSLTAREVKERNPRLLSHVSLRCVQQALHDDLGFKSFRARRKPLLTKRQKENRGHFMCSLAIIWPRKRETTDIDDLDNEDLLETIFSSRKMRKKRSRDAGAAINIHHTGNGLVAPRGLINQPRTAGLEGWIPTGIGMFLENASQLHKGFINEDEAHQSREDLFSESATASNAAINSANTVIHKPTHTLMDRKSSSYVTQNWRRKSRSMLAMRNGRHRGALWEVMLQPHSSFSTGLGSLEMPPLETTLFGSSVELLRRKLEKVFTWKRLESPALRTDARIPLPSKLTLVDDGCNFSSELNGITKESKRHLSSILYDNGGAVTARGTEAAVKMGGKYRPRERKLKMVSNPMANIFEDGWRIAVLIESTPRRATRINTDLRPTLSGNINNPRLLSRTKYFHKL
ncbi:putative Transposase-containing protein 21, partial [Homarus americanus]